MTDREFYLEIRKGLLIIMRAMMRKYGLTWLDFLPREQVDVVIVPFVAGG
mgnify:CR=1 FL=1